MDAKLKKYAWETTFNESKQIMTHVFNRRVSVVCNFKFKMIIVARDGEPIDKFSFAEAPMSLGEYETFLLRIAKTASLLE